MTTTGKNRIMIYGPKSDALTSLNSGQPQARRWPPRRSDPALSGGDGRGPCRSQSRSRPRCLEVSGSTRKAPPFRAGPDVHFFDTCKGPSRIPTLRRIHGGISPSSHLLSLRSPLVP
jgi:hypothetical protein